jgi:hypothetical protein
MLRTRMPTLFTGQEFEMEDRSNPPAKKRGYKEENIQSTQEIGAHPRGASELDEVQNVSASSNPTSTMDQETINLLDDDRVSTGG